MQPTIRQLHHFVALAETGQVSRAALRCHVSQSAMTASLQGLEKVLGVDLFMRQASGIRLTTEGLRFLRNAQRVISSLDEAVSDIRTVPVATRGTVRIGLTETISAYLMPRVLPALHRKFPQLEVVCIEQERQQTEEALLAGKLDLALMLTSNLSGHPGLHCETLLRSNRQFWASQEHPLLLQERVSLADIATQHYLLLDMDEHLTTVQRYWGHHGLRPRVSLQSQSIEAVRSLVAAGEGVTILSDLVYRPWSLEGQRIVRRPISDEVPSMDVGLVWSHTHDAPALWQALIQFLRDVISS
ncbi:DNA-binding transcriptional regulator, LysR family [Pseudomonas flavescens]|uniref:DNA-binding transcriptional regulator, LysR family n=1 Tax=Phytopseudomonas flavescens TaxID=29435 RepID=A0A1G7ZLS4_9GAMM|nr:LysR family transcriptional regulator [Pseudomonas flavescens]SDH09638.1 DNA-binding transcriptional regulator, LysR family [Pseudomonas flavescens]